MDDETRLSLISQINSELAEVEGEITKLENRRNEYRDLQISINNLIDELIESRAATRRAYSHLNDNYKSDANNDLRLNLNRINTGSENLKNI